LLCSRYTGILLWPELRMDFTVSVFRRALDDTISTCNSPRHKVTNRQADIQLHTIGQTEDVQANKQTDRQTDGQTDRQTDRKTDRQTDRQTDKGRRDKQGQDRPHIGSQRAWSRKTQFLLSNIETQLQQSTIMTYLVQPQHFFVPSLLAHTPTYLIVFKSVSTHSHLQLALMHMQLHFLVPKQDYIAGGRTSAIHISM
jgi:hypothetical protein